MFNEWTHVERARRAQVVECRIVQRAWRRLHQLGVEVSRESEAIPAHAAACLRKQLAIQALQRGGDT